MAMAIPVAFFEYRSRFCDTPSTRHVRHHKTTMGKVMGEKRRPGHQIGNEPADQPEPEVKQRKQKRKSSSAVSAADATTVSVPPPLRRSKRQRSVRVGKGATRTQNSNTNDDNGDDRVISSEKAHDEGSCITSTGSESTAMKKTRLDAVAARTCPHCQREFSTKQSRNVHILSFICRPKESSDAANGDIPVPTRKRKRHPTDRSNQARNDREDLWRIEPVRIVKECLRV